MTGSSRRAYGPDMEHHESPAALTAAGMPASVVSFPPDPGLLAVMRVP